MSHQIASELMSFHEFVAEKLGQGAADLSPEDALDQWRALHPDPEDLQESVAAIRQALLDIENGDKGRPSDDVLAEIRSRYNLPSP